MPVIDSYEVCSYTYIKYMLIYVYDKNTHKQHELLLQLLLRELLILHCEKSKQITLKCESFFN